MSRPVTIATTSASGGASNWLPLDYFTAGFGVGLFVVAEGSAVRYTVQHTSYDVGRLGTTGLSAQAIYNHATLVAATADADGNYAFPPAAVRIVLVSGSATAIARLTVIEAGP